MIETQEHLYYTVEYCSCTELHKIDMACSKHIRIPATWLYPHQKILQDPPKSDSVTPKELVDWLCHEVKLGDEAVVNHTFYHLNPYLFVSLMYPRLPSDPWSKKLYELNVYFLVAAYILDDYHMENYTTSLIKKMLAAFNSVNKEMDERFPDCPRGAEIVQSLSYVENPSAQYIIATMTDYINRSALIVWYSGRVQLSRARDFRKRMAGTLRAYFHGVQMKGGHWTTLSVSQFLWARCPESGAPCYYLSNEFFSGFLEITSSIPLVMLYNHYMYGSAVCSVVNDLVSLDRDTSSGDVNIVKILDKSGNIEDMEVAVSAILQLLESFVRYIYNSTKEVKKEYPECSSWFDFINDMTIGWIYIHTFTLRYASSPDKVFMTPLHGEMLHEWLNEKENTSIFTDILAFQKLLDEKQDKMKMLYAF